ncbi:hypothetical protein ACROYT_G026039 [Oculina patagonica]
MDKSVRRESRTKIRSITTQRKYTCQCSFSENHNLLEQPEPTFGPLVNLVETLERKLLLLYSKKSKNIQEMATHLKIVLLPCLLVFMVLMEDVKPVLAKQGERLKQRTKILEDTVRELNERIKALEECEACSKIKGRNETSSESQEKIDSKPECQNYTSLISADRKITFSVYASSKCDDKLVPAWYRFQGAAGTRMPTSCPPDWRCGTVATGWLNGEHPSVAEAVNDERKWTQNMSKVKPLTGIPVLSTQEINGQAISTRN